MLRMSLLIGKHWFGPKIDNEREPKPSRRMIQLEMAIAGREVLVRTEGRKTTAARNQVGA